MITQFRHSMVIQWRRQHLQSTSMWGESATTVQDVFEFDYDNGWGGTTADTNNQSCTSPTASGCWGSREGTLTQFTPLLAGERVSTYFGGACVSIQQTGSVGGETLSCAWAGGSI